MDIADIIFEKAKLTDAVVIAELEKMCFSDPWSLNMVTQEIANYPLSRYIVAKLPKSSEITFVDTVLASLNNEEIMELDEEVLVAYIGVWLVGNEGHITNVAVNPKYRKKHIGERLVLHCLDTMRTIGVVNFTLEVRESNAPAISLYEKLGFENVGVRPHYYHDGEGAVIMWNYGE